MQELLTFLGFSILFVGGVQYFVIRFRRRRTARRSRPLLWFFLFLTGVIALQFWPFQLVASPDSRLRLVDERGNPLVGVKITREWSTSEEQKGENVGVTDSDGQVRFARVAFPMSRLKLLTKMLLVLVPASCGPGWEVYGLSEFHIFWPPGHAVHFDDGSWHRTYEVYENRDKFYIGLPEVRWDGSELPKEDNYVRLFFFNKPNGFDYTLTLFRK